MGGNKFTNFLLFSLFTAILITQNGYSGQSETKSSGAKVSGKNFTNSIGMKFIFIGPGTFIMGSPSSESGRKSGETQHQVTLTKGYYLQTTEVTEGQWKAVMGDQWVVRGIAYSFEDDGLPMTLVSGPEAKEFIRKLNQKEGGNKYRLPTEAEWEYAARAGSTSRYCFGDSEETLGSSDWYSGNSGRKIHPVAQKLPNAWGLYDMLGNVMEWCQDLYKDYTSDSVTDPTGSSSDTTQVHRGGSAYHEAKYCRSAARDGCSMDAQFGNLGFRLVRDI